MTYTLYADTNQAKDASDTAVLYDLVYEDGAPEIEQLNGSYTDADGVTHELGYTARVLGAEEYDFTRVKVRKLIDGNTVLINTNTGTRLRNTFKRTQYVGTYENPSATHYGDSTYSLSWLRESTTAIDAFTSIEKFVYHDAWSELSEEEKIAAGSFRPSDYYATNITSSGIPWNLSRSAPRTAGN